MATVKKYRIKKGWMDALENIDFGSKDTPKDLMGLIQKLKNDAVKSQKWELAVMARQIEKLVQANDDKVGEGFPDVNTRIKHWTEPTEQKPQDRPLPLFVTEDGEEIFYGDKFWVVDSDWSIYQPPFAHEESGKQIERKYFYSEQAAKEYVLLNKPFMSVQDVMNRLHAYFAYPIEAMQNLKNFAKQTIS
jgi:hypothetical protein